MFYFFLVLVVSCASGSAEPPIKEKPFPAVRKSQEDMTSKILVRFKTGTGQDKIKNIQDKYGLETVRTLGQPGLYLMKVSGDMKIKTVIEELKKHNKVMYTEPDHAYRINDN